MAQGIENKLEDRHCNKIIYILHYLLAMQWNEGRIKWVEHTLTKLIAYKVTSGNIILNNIEINKENNVSQRYFIFISL